VELELKALLVEQAAPVEPVITEVQEALAVPELKVLSEVLVERVSQVFLVRLVVLVERAEPEELVALVVRELKGLLVIPELKALPVFLESLE